MCGRYANFLPTPELQLRFDLNEVSEWARNYAPNYNVAPTTSVPVIIEHGPRRADDGGAKGVEPGSATSATGRSGVAGSSGAASSAERSAAGAADRPAVIRELLLARWGWPGSTPGGKIPRANGFFLPPS